MCQYMNSDPCVNTANKLLSQSRMQEILFLFNNCVDHMLWVFSISTVGHFLRNKAQGLKTLQPVIGVNWWVFDAGQMLGLDGELL